MTTQSHNSLFRRAYNLRLHALLLFALLIPRMAFSQQGSGGTEFRLILECVQDLGNGTYRANFGYYNPGTETITVSPEKSKLIYKENFKKLFLIKIGIG